MKNRMRELRIKRGVSQIFLSSRVGIHYSTLSRLECGWIKGTHEQRRAIAAFFKIKKELVFPQDGKSKKREDLDENILRRHQR